MPVILAAVAADEGKSLPKRAPCDDSTCKNPRFFRDPSIGMRIAVCIIQL